jgi:hypothetical protein
VTPFRFDTVTEIAKSQGQAAKPAKAAKGRPRTDKPAGGISESSNFSRMTGAEALTGEFLRNGRIRIESDWAGVVWLVASQERLHGNEDGTVYFPNEVRFLVALSHRERQLLHGFKKHFGCRIEAPGHNDGEDR